MHREVRSKILLKKSLETKSKWQCKQRLTAEAGGFGTVNPDPHLVDSSGPSLKRSHPLLILNLMLSATEFSEQYFCYRRYEVLCMNLATFRLWWYLLKLHPAAITGS